MKNLTVGILFLCLLFLSGCILPLPHFKKTSEPLCGYIVVGEPNIPVVDAHIEISYPDGGFRETTTNEQGYFAFPTKMRFHWGVMIGIALNYSLPYDMFAGHYSQLTVDVEGYETLTVLPEFFEGAHPLAIEEPNAIFSDLIICPEISLDKRKITREYVSP